MITIEDIAMMVLDYFEHNSEKEVVHLCRLTGRARHEYDTIKKDAKLSVLMIGKSGMTWQITWQYAKIGKIATYTTEIHELYLLAWIYAKTKTQQLTKSTNHTI